MSEQETIAKILHEIEDLVKNETKSMQRLPHSSARDSQNILTQWKIVGLKEAYDIVMKYRKV